MYTPPVPHPPLNAVCTCVHVYAEMSGCTAHEGILQRCREACSRRREMLLQAPTRGESEVLSYAFHSRKIACLESGQTENIHAHLPSKPDAGSLLPPCQVDWPLRVVWEPATGCNVEVSGAAAGAWHVSGGTSSGTTPHLARSSRLDGDSQGLARF